VGRVLERYGVGALQRGKGGEPVQMEGFDRGEAGAGHGGGEDVEGAEVVEVEGVGGVEEG